MTTVETKQVPMDQGAQESLADVASAAVESLDSAPQVPSSILPIPNSMLSSVSSWWNVSAKQTAEAEFFLYSKSGYFQGAFLGNAKACSSDGPDALAEAYALVHDDAAAQPTSISKVNQFMTVGSQLSIDGKVGCIRMVDIGAEKSTSFLNMFRGQAKRYINTLEIGTPLKQEEQPKDEEKIVLVHGYGAGSAFFFKNVDAFAAPRNSRFFALDWLGMGRSSRPAYRTSHTEARTVERVDAAESFFLTSLEQWREKMKIEKMTLVGHSLGGYLSLAYALKYPERVSNLILVSPVGIPVPPNELRTLKENKHANPEDLDHASISSTSSGNTISSEDLQRSKPQSMGARTRNILGWLWDRNMSPFSVLRNSAIFGPLLMSAYTKRRFSALSPDEKLCLHAYCHGVFTGRGSSEYCLADILAPGAFARLPMVRRISSIKVNVSFLYGSHDWMDVNGGIKAKRVLGAAGNPNVRVFIVKKSGHHLYLDNATEFNKLIKQLLPVAAP
ncbi:hypothetical protein MVES1_000465 [Malassezia vespertilionis]|uniref:AB hydrolase-1 domain-containing protein n=1 Tax=Malassezia vespertilionis TaxID=2020962 RepID=A0A2N1JHL4_9BASI|nr:uncharacterized protein MVES1_000465 [Malassezia vespertilionis]PKI86050.1 hypothetical protein MVES_000427 [Malassezia vespertilionis]WFD05139.1 hypothetical protein MVES1_000465 [Malassezia vespertilionis]